MNFDEYQDAMEETAIYPEDGEVAGVPVGILYTASGLSGEAGECMEKVKKAMREDEEEYLEQLEDELGDVLWYASQLARELDMDYSEVAERNADKILDRQARDKLTGQGDYR